MDEFVFFGEFRMKEYARKAEQLNRQAWMIAEAGPDKQPRRRFPRLRGA